MELDEQMVRACIRNQEEEDERYDQIKLAIEYAANGGSRFHERLCGAHNLKPPALPVVRTPVEARKSHGGSPCQGMPGPCS